MYAEFKDHKCYFTSLLHYQVRIIISTWVSQACVQPSRFPQKNRFFLGEGAAVHRLGSVVFSCCFCPNHQPQKIPGFSVPRRHLESGGDPENEVGT